jgi:FkbM family methyltransferase
MSKLTSYKFQYEGSDLEIIGRPGVASDREIIAMIFISKMFSTDRFPAHHAALQNYYQHMIEQRKTPAIIDAGANIGAASRYFNELYGHAKIYAIEPGEENYSILQANMTGKNFVGLPGAISSKDGILYLNTVDHGPIGYRTGLEGDTEVTAYSLKSIIESLPKNESVFLLKIDIEGAESEVFSGDSNYLASTPLVIMEPHDWMLPFRASSQNFYQQVSKYSFDILMHGENIFCFNNAILSKYR